MTQETKRSAIRTFARIAPIENLNNGFTLCKCRVHGLGLNRNCSYISKENVLRNLHTINYIPVVGHLIQEADGKMYMGEHDFEIDWDKGEIRTLTLPLGVVINDSHGFEMVEEGGIQVEYLTCHLVLWTDRYPDIKKAIYSEDVWFNESMELDVTRYKPYEHAEWANELIDFSYSALCLLGKSDSAENPHWNTDPCFLSSQVYPVSYANQQEAFSAAMNEMRKHLGECFAHFHEKGGTHLNQEKIDAILAEYGVSPSDLGFEITESMTEDELRKQLSALEGQSDPPPANDPVDEGAAEDGGDDPEGADEPEEGKPDGGEPEEDSLRQQLALLTEENQRLRVENEVFRAQKADMILAQFTDLDGDPGFETIREQKVAYDLEALETACFALRGRRVKVDTNGVGKLPIGNTEEDEEKPYGDLFD